MRSLLMKTSASNLTEFSTFMKAFEINCSIESITKDQINLYFTAFKPFPMAEVKTAFQKVLYNWE